MTARTPGRTLEQIMQAVRTRTAKILIANGYATNAVFVNELSQVIRDPAAQDAAGNRGILVLVEEDVETPEYFPTLRVRMHLTYTIRASLYIDPQAQFETLRQLVRAFRGDLWKNHYSDLYLCTANADNGNANEQLVAEHRFVSMQSDYAWPEASVVAEVSCVYDFNADDL